MSPYTLCESWCDVLNEWKQQAFNLYHRITPNPVRKRQPVLTQFTSKILHVLPGGFCEFSPWSKALDLDIPSR